MDTLSTHCPEAGMWLGYRRLLLIVFWAFAIDQTRENATVVPSDLTCVFSTSEFGTAVRCGHGSVLQLEDVLPLRDTEVPTIPSKERRARGLPALLEKTEREDEDRKESTCQTPGKH